MGAAQSANGSREVDATSVTYWEQEGKAKKSWKRTVTTVDNGGRPIRVELRCDKQGTLFGSDGAGTAVVYTTVLDADESDSEESESEESENGKPDKYEMWTKFDFKEAFVAVDVPNELPPISVPRSSADAETSGVCLRDKAAERRRSDLWYAGGHAVLLSLKSDAQKNEYVYICEGAWKFTAAKGDEILRFHSVMGNDAVPYPFAIGRTHAYSFSTIMD
ncbi:MAG: hypothetical protein ABEI52_12220, partial [Halobacteriaceae archaeon]